MLDYDENNPQVLDMAYVITDLEDRMLDLEAENERLREIEQEYLALLEETTLTEKESI